ncbi:ABC transporter ATP-binding protein [Maritalea porphyrae]|uniref:ABC transporter ATP-binding protein n=1 Tax=Maritalea porphyrae TaxID=880732 RepID=UPI0022AE77CB|nr:ABC transporter ATP-binding protein [Maritalea porphyrae]MCZ4271127.1 ABC transporter ATP-binding protein [Maritalea porphyrae]
MLNSIFAWFEKHYSPIHIEPNPHPPMGLLKFYWYFIGQFRTPVMFKVIIVAIGAALDAMIPIFLGTIVDLVSGTEPGTLFKDQGALLLAMGITLALRPSVFVLDILIQYHTIVPSLVGRVRWQSHWHVVRQSWTFFQKDFAGRIASKIFETGPSLENSAMEVIDAVWYMVVFFIVATGVLANQDIVFLFPLLGWAAAYLLLMYFSLPAIAKQSKINSNARSVVTGRMVDCYANIQTLKTFATGSLEDKYVADSVEENIKQFRLLMRVFSRMWMSLFVINTILLITTGYLALSWWNKGLITTGQFAMIVPFVWQLLNISGWILEVASGIFRDMGTVRDGMETISKPLTMVDEPNAPELAVEKAGIAFEDVKFNYDGGEDKRVIDELNLDIRPGEKVGLIGRSGAGKSTIVNLLLRLFDAEEGVIAIDGQDISRVGQDSLRQAIGFVSQDTSLLHRSVGDNIKYGKPDATDEQMVEAARRAKIHDVILDLQDEDGNKAYEAKVGERGVKLSGGQRQRIAIARVLLKDAPILVLDEATSALDSEVEAAIQEQLTELMADKTVIAIAHRLSTIAAMDRLLVMDEGRVVEQGTHDELLERDGHYAQLWKRQSGGFAAAE